MRLRYARFFLFLFVNAMGVLMMRVEGCDPCNDYDCGDKGVCLEGDCICDPGWLGVQCGIQASAVLPGTYEAGDLCFNTGGGTFNVQLLSLNAEGENWLFVNPANHGDTIALSWDQYRIILENEVVLGADTVIRLDLSVLSTDAPVEIDVFMQTRNGSRDQGCRFSTTKQ